MKEKKTFTMEPADENWSKKKQGFRRIVKMIKIASWRAATPFLKQDSNEKYFAVGDFSIWPRNKIYATSFFAIEV